MSPEVHRVVGPPSEELICFGAMSLRVYWFAAFDIAPLQEAIVFSAASDPDRDDRWLERFTSRAANHDQTYRFPVNCLQPAAGRN